MDAVSKERTNDTDKSQTSDVITVGSWEPNCKLEKKKRNNQLWVVRTTTAGIVLQDGEDELETVPPAYELR
ncbi:hypothetical protein A0H81_01537 [Grifola frondosa]|uniref:Uncharacterized protein n=1 Tax=Grifola frondosa TaxID=5627 RepID=A0A1C7MSP1_GRIFR|nr:hypothetical protein A0H81_01537 [Grifola frondosa]